MVVVRGGWIEVTHPRLPAAILTTAVAEQCTKIASWICFFLPREKYSFGKVQERH